MTAGLKLLSKILKVCLYLGAATLIPDTAGAMNGASLKVQLPDPPLELVFVIDNSGSMKVSDPKFQMRLAVKKFVMRLPQQSRVGLVLFDEKIHPLQPLQTIARQQTIQHLFRSLDSISYDGRYTNGPGGIERALYEFKTNGRPESRKAIVFITDGIVTNSDRQKTKELLEWLKRDLMHELQLLGIQIYGVAVTESADIALIQTLASRTEGEYFRAREATGLSNALERIGTLLINKGRSMASEQPQPHFVSKNDGPEMVQLAKDKAPPSPIAHRKWPQYLYLALITLLVTTMAFLFFTKRKWPKAEPTLIPEPEASSNLPQARLSNLNSDAVDGQIIYELDKTVTSIGRGAQNDLCLSQDSISIRHASIEFKHPAFYLTDLESTNGTRLNSDKLAGYESVRLKDGDTIRIGPLKYRFEIPEQRLFQETMMLEGTALNAPENCATLMIFDGKEDDDKEDLLACLKNHLQQIEALGSKYKRFVQEKFCSETQSAIVADGECNLQKTLMDGLFHSTPYICNRVFYLICTLPVDIAEAAGWYGNQYSGFTEFIHQWVNDHSYQSANCDSICIITFGQAASHWVSITNIPSCHDPESVEIISVDFLNPEEQSILTSAG